MTAIDTINQNLLASARKIANLPDETTAGFDDDNVLVVQPNGKISIDVENQEQRKFQHRVAWVTGRHATFTLPNHVAVEDVSEFITDHLSLFRQLCAGMSTASDRNGNTVADYTEEAEAAEDKIRALIDEVLSAAAQNNPRYTLDPKFEFEAVKDQLADQDSPEAAVELALEWAEESCNNNHEYVIDEAIIEKYAKAMWHEYNPHKDEDDEEDDEDE